MIGFLPQKLIDQIAVGPMQRHAVEAQPIGGLRPVDDVLPRPTQASLFDAVELKGSL
jgi:hypothetical protein